MLWESEFVGISWALRAHQQVRAQHKTQGHGHISFIISAYPWHNSFFPLSYAALWGSACFPRMLPLTLEPGQDGARQKAQLHGHSFASVLMRVVLLTYTSHFTSVKSVKIHKGLCATGGRLYHVILEVSAAWKNSTYVLARCMPAVQKLWQAAIQGTVDTLLCCNYVIMCLCLFGSSTWGEGPAVSCVLYSGIFVRTSSLFFGFFWDSTVWILKGASGIWDNFHFAAIYSFESP